MYPGQLIDIRGLDAIPWWPPAPGWWLATLFLIAAIIGLILLGRYLILYPPGSWRWEARRALVQLKRQQGKLSHKEVAARLSELLRRISIARLGRPAVAGLTGSEWLQCLERLDPRGYPWIDRGKPLLTLPYAPENGEAHLNTLEELIQAAMQMVRYSHPGLKLKKGTKGDGGV